MPSSTLPRVLAVCRFGQNRSVYLAEYLRGLGYPCDYAGVETDTRATLQRKIAIADVLVMVDAYVTNALANTYEISGKKLITLDIPENPYNASALRSAIASHLPLGT